MLYYKCKECGFERLVNLQNPTDCSVSCPNCDNKIIYSEQIEKDWLNEVDKNGKYLRMKFKGSDEKDCLLEAVNYFKCTKKELDYYIVKRKGLFNPFIICAWKSVLNITSKDVKIILDSSNSNGWIAINSTDKIIIKPASLTPIRIKYNKVLSIKYNEHEIGYIDCELVLEPHQKINIGFYPQEKNNVSLLIDTLYNDLPQYEDEIYTLCFFKKNQIQINAEVCHVTIDNINIDLGNRCFVWRDNDFLYMCNTVIRNGIKIKISNIKYYRIMGNKYVTTEITGGNGGGSSIKGAVIGGLIAGEAGAIIGSRKPIEAIKSTSTIHDEQKVLLYSTDSAKIFIFNSSIYKVLLKLLPEKEYESGSQAQPTNITSSDTTDIKSKLRELKSMYEEDLITEEEYNNKRQELLSKM